MTNSTNQTPAGCVLCLVQLSDSMRPRSWDLPWIKQTLPAAFRLIEHVLRDLPAPAEVGVVGYRAGPAGVPEFVPLLPGAGADRVLVPVSELGSNGVGPLLAAEASGTAPARAALEHARAVLSGWIAAHPGAPAPVVIHCTDGADDDGPVGPAARDLTTLEAAGGPAFLCTCVFRRKIPPALFPNPPADTWRELWETSSPLPSGGEVNRAGARALTLNYFAPSTIARLIRSHWEATATRAADPAHVEASPLEADPDPPRPPEPRFETRTLLMPKRGNTEAEWEDAVEHDRERGIVAVCDGASDGIFSKTWADLLCGGYVANPIDLDDPDAVKVWVQGLRRAWTSAIDFPSLRWSVQLRLERSCGAATLLAFRLLDERPGSEIAWRAWAVGDACLFHVRANQLLFEFPVEKATDFGITPPLFRSKPMGTEPVVVATEGVCLPGDLFLFATDALAQRLLLTVEEGTPPDWERYWSIDPDEWRQEIEALRDRTEIVNDDCTLLAVRVAGARPPGPEPALEPELLSSACDASPNLS